MTRKVTSVLELSKYKIGDVAYWLTLQTPIDIPEISEDDSWLTFVHPKQLYQGPFKKLWPFCAKLPRLHHADFTTIVTLITSELCVEEFVICSLIRSDDTGEFYYANIDDEWMPEPCLFDSAAAARRERIRIMKLIRKWAKDS